MVNCPEENQPGDRLIVTAPRAAPQQFVVAVPATSSPGNVKVILQFFVFVFQLFNLRLQIHYFLL